MKKNYNIKMDKERIKRYKEKQEKLSEYLKYLKDWTQDLEVEDFNKTNIKEQFSIYHAFQIVVEIITDLSAMVVKDLKKIPKDDYSNLETLAKEKIITKELSSYIKEANGLRNRIVHDYNNIDDDIAYKSILNVLNRIKQFKEVIDEWLKKNK